MHFPLGFLKKKKSVPRTLVAHKGWFYTNTGPTPTWELITELWREGHDSVPSVRSYFGKHTERGEGSEGVGVLM